jgi:hypothetical protein
MLYILTILIFDVINLLKNGEEQGTNYATLIADYARFLDEVSRKIINSLTSPTYFDFTEDVSYDVFSWLGS